MALANWMLSNPGDRAVSSEMTLVDGYRMHYLRAGAGPDVVLLHGLLGTAAAWGASIERLSTGFSVYAVDAIGIGKSERVPKLDTSLMATADRLIKFMDSVGIWKADLVATSHGGAVAIMVASLYPNRVRSLVLHAPANPYSEIADSLIRFYGTRAGEWFAHRVPRLPRSLQHRALARMYGNSRSIAEGTLERYVHSLAVPGTVDHVLSILRGWFREMHELDLALNHVANVQTLLLWGTEDRAVSVESAQALKRRFHSAELVLIPGAGHLPYEEVPAAFCTAVASFLREKNRTAHAPERRLGPALVKQD